MVQDSKQSVFDLDLQQFIPRGTQVKQSGAVYMLVIYTGKDTKQILNQGNYKFKYSLIDTAVNLLLAWNIFLTIVLLGLPLATQAASFVSAHRETHTYLAIDDKPTSVQGI